MCGGESPRNFPSHPHENDACAVTPCTAIQGQNKCHFSEAPLGTPFWAMEFLFFRAKGTRRKNDNTKVTLGLARKQTGGNDICVTTRITIGCRRKARCRQSLRLQRIGQGTEQVKTGQVNLDHMSGHFSWALPCKPSWDASWDQWWGVLEGLRTRKINLRECSRGCSRGRSRGRIREPTRGPTRGATRRPTRGSTFAFACSVRRPRFNLVNPFLTKLMRISGFSSLFSAIAAFSAHFAGEC